jgi:large repetitive protein
MRKLLSMLFLAVFLFTGIISSAQAQSGVHPVAAGKFDVRFTVKSLDCSVSPKTLTIAVQVKSKTMADTFLMGDANYRFRFKTTQLRLLGTSPAFSQSLVSQENFSSALASPNRDFNYGIHNLNGSGEGPTEGIVSLNTFYSGSNQGGKLVTTTWATVACIKFTVVSGPTECFDLTWNTNNDFPVTGMNEVYNLITDPSYDYKQENVAAGGYFGNVNQCAGTYCSPILAVNDINTTPQNTAVSGQLLTNDIGSGLVVTTTPIANPANGTVVLNANGSYTYTPTTGFTGTDSFKYKVCDNLTPQKCDTALVTISVIPPVLAGQNAPPVAQNDAKQTLVGVPVLGNVLSNDFDPNAGQTLTVTTTPVSPPVNGTVVLNANGTYTYTPTPGFSGADSFTYKVCDNGSPVLCSNATVYLDIVPKNTPATANDKPNAGDDAGITPKNVAITGTLSSNDSDPNAGQILAYTTTPISAPAHGTVTITATGSYTYTPTTGYTGSDAFTYKVCDNGSPVLCDTATVYLTVTPSPNNPPVVTTPATTPVITEDATTPITVCVTYTDADAVDTHTPTICGALNGTATFASQNTTSTPKQICFTYKPNPNFSGTDSVCVKVCDSNGACSTVKVPITVTPVNDPPVVVAVTLTMPEDSAAKTICLPITDPDLPTDSHIVGLCKTPMAGSTVTVSVNNTTHQVCITYKPALNFAGKDTVCLSVCDAAGVCTTVKIPVVVTPVNDPPVVVRTPQTVGQNSLISPLCLPIADVDAGDTHTVTVCAVARNGTATPTVNNVTHQVCLNYKPTTNYVGQDSVCITVCDAAGLCTNVFIPIIVTSVPTAPTLTPKQITMPEDSAAKTVCMPILDINVGDTHTVTLCAAPKHAVSSSVVVNNITHELCITYKPLPNYSGQDTICVVVCDQAGLCVTVNVPIVVTPVADPPIPTPPVLITPPVGTTKTTCFPFTDADPTGTHTVSLCTPATAHGTASVTVNDITKEVCLTYTPTAGYVGPDQVCVKVCDVSPAQDTCRTVTININVSATANPPVVVPSPIAAIEDGAPVTVCMNITDPDAGQFHIATLCNTPTSTKGTASAVVNNTTTPHQVCVTYTPLPNQSGKDTVCVSVCDNTGLCTIVKVPVVIAPVPDPPVVAVTPIVTTEDTSKKVCMPITDPDGSSSFTISLCAAPKNGSAQVALDNTTGMLCITYTPNPNFNGTDSVCVKVCDNTGLCTDVKVPITVTQVNDKPVAINDVNITPKATPVSGTVLTNDLDPDLGQTLSVSTTPVSNPLNGTVTLNANGTYTYTPNPTFVGTESFKYRVCDSGTPTLCDTATVVIEVYDPAPSLTNKAPLALDDNTTTPQGTPIVIAVKNNDIDPDGNTLGNPSLAITPTKGTAVVNPDGTITYTPNPTATGTDTFKYVICDNGTPSKCDSATVTVEITPKTSPSGGATNDPPSPTGDAKTTLKNTQITSSLAINDTDPNPGQLLTFTKLTDPINGTVTLNANGTYTYSPNSGFVGNDSFTYQVCDNGTPVMCAISSVTIVVTEPSLPAGVTNVPPVATDDNPATQKGTPVIIVVKANDYDPFGGILSNPVAITTPTNGTLTTNPDGTFTYSPNPTFTGIDSFKYRVCDNGTPSLCDTATVTINVVAGNTVPPTGPVNIAPTAIDDAKATFKNIPVSGTIAPNDTDPNVGQTLTFTSTSTPLNGILTSFNPATGAYTYTPNNNFVGNDKFTYKVCDNGTPSLCSNATVYLTVTNAPNTPPTIGNPATTPTMPEDGGSVTVCLPITDPDALDTHTVTPCGALNGSVTYSVNNLSTPHQVCATYTPNPNFSGTDSICVKVCDSFGNCVTKKIPVIVTPTNDPPVVVPVPTTLPEDGTITVCLPVTDPDANDLHSVTMCAAPKTGTATLSVNNATTPHQVCITYTPLPNFSGRDTVCVRVCDAAGVCTDVKVPFVVTPVNDAPFAENDVINTPAGSPVLGNVLTNDTDPEGNPLTVTGPLAGALPTKGTVVMSPTGVYTYTPNPTATGTDTFKYQVCDNGTPSLCDTATVTITITPSALMNGTNLPPITTPDITSTPKGTPLIINVLANDGDPEGLPLSNPTITTPPTKGTVVINPNGTITYTPNPGVTGDDTFTYQVCDTGSPVACTNQTVTVTVTPPLNVVSNDPPVPTDDAKTMNKNGSLTTSVATNDTDPNAGQLLTYSNTSSPVNGTLVFNPNGTFTYTPTLGFVGNDSFTYKVCDNGSPVMCSNASVYLTIIDPTVTQPANTLPVALDDNSTTPKGIAVIITVKANDIYTAGTLGNPTTTTSPLNGSVVTNANGTMTYTPTAGFVGVDTYRYKVCDASNPAKCDTAVVTITVKDPAASVAGVFNNPPVAIDDYKITTKGTSVSATVALNDSDPDAGQTLAFTKLTNPANGTIVFNAATGAYTYTPNATFVGSDMFTYKVCDNGSPVLCTNATAYITVLDQPCVTFDLKVILQGPYNSSTGLMGTVLNQRGLLPGQTPVGTYATPTAGGQPYNVLPFSYAGSETMTAYPTTVVDWVLVTLRSDSTKASKVLSIAGLLHSDGHISFVNPCIILPTGSYYVVIEHRNHMGVMSHVKVPLSASKITYDFTAQQSYQLTNPPSFGQKAIGTKFVMYAADGSKATVNDNYDINFKDSQLWKVLSGNFDIYLLSDFNLDADSNFMDNSLWKTNSGRYSGVLH